MSLLFSMIIDPAAIGFLASECSTERLHVLREMHRSQETLGCVEERLLKDASDMAKKAAEHGIVRREGSRWRLTASGYKLGNLAKEYGNWIEAGRPLLEGLNHAMVKDKRVLDVGCGCGRTLLGLQRLGVDAVGVDLEEFYLRSLPFLAAKEGVKDPKAVRARAERLPFPGHSFDVVYCRLVLNYVVDVPACLKEFARVLSPGGRLVLDYRTMRDGVADMMRTRWVGNWRHAGWQAFGLVNSVILELTGRQWVVGVNGRMHERHSPTFPRAAWIRKVLARSGFEIVTAANGSPRPSLFHAVRIR